MIRFVTGTDTGVGKTVASAWLAAEASEAGRSVRYVKPLQTGLAPDEPNADADFVRASAGVESLELHRFPEPLAPSVAAELAGETIDPEALVASIKQLDDVDELIVEGAGGLLVPITDSWTMADLARGLDGDVVIVTRPGLGTLNHTALTLEAARARNLTVTGLVVSGWPAGPGLTERTNLERLEAMAPVIHLIPFTVGLSVEGGDVEALRRAISASRSA
jgi:dethiobiotin synthetase